MSQTARTQVGIVGAGPAGLLLSQLLDRQGIDTIVLERRSRAYVESRIRAGVLESGTVELIDAAGVGTRMHEEGLVHEGIEIAIDGTCHRIDFRELVGDTVMVYGQTEVTKDLNNARAAAGASIVFEAEDVSVHDLDGEQARIRYRKDGEEREVVCDFIAGCDGFHGVCRRAIPETVLKTFERIYPFAWLGILAETPPVSEELIYAYHQRGFALFSMRSQSLSRLYVQCRPDADLQDWPDERGVGGTGSAAWRRRGDTAQAGAFHREEHHAHAQFRGRAHAPRPPVPCRRCGPHRTADRRQGPQSGGRRRARTARGSGRVLQLGQCRPARYLFGTLPAQGVEGAALLLVDDVAPAPVPGTLRL